RTPLGGGGGSGGVPIGGGHPGAPAITAVNPGSGAPGTAITIDGQGFATASSGEIVRFGGTTAGVQSTSATRIVAVVPSHAAGSAPITVEVRRATSAAAAVPV